MKKNLIIYWIFTGLLSIWMLLQAYMFVFNAEQVNEMFSGLGAPIMLVIPLGIAKLLAVIAIVSNLSTILKQLAYLGLAIDFLVALVLHLMAGDGYWTLPTIALILVVGSYFYDKKK